MSNPPVRAEPARTVVSLQLDPEDLVFDIGTHFGSKLELFLRQGAKVVCVEPQPDCIAALLEKYRDNNYVLLLRKGAGAKLGGRKLSICSKETGLSTFSDEWKHGRFSEYRWDRSLDVQMTTLDVLIRDYGVPKYCNIDVEGFEWEVLQGLSSQIPHLSFEFTGEYLDNAERCLTRLQKLRYRSFNAAIGGSLETLFPDYVSAEVLLESLHSSEDVALWGDIYAKAPGL